MKKIRKEKHEAEMNNQKPLFNKELFDHQQQLEDDKKNNKKNLKIQKLKKKNKKKYIKKK